MRQINNSSSCCFCRFGTFKCIFIALQMIEVCSCFVTDGLEEIVRLPTSLFPYTLKEVCLFLQLALGAAEEGKGG